MNFEEEKIIPDRAPETSIEDIEEAIATQEAILESNLPDLAALTSGQVEDVKSDTEELSDKKWYQNKSFYATFMGGTFLGVSATETITDLLSRDTSNMALNTAAIALAIIYTGASLKDYNNLTPEIEALKDRILDKFQKIRQTT